MALSIGIVGLPNVGVVPVPDERLDKLSALVKPLKKIPTSLEFVDIAGLVRGASKGEGLGNQFLANIRQVDAVLHVLRCFEDDNVTHVEGGVNPVRDRDVVDTELCLKDLETVEKRRERAQKNTKMGGKAGDEAKAELALLDRVKAGLDSGITVRAQKLNEEDSAAIRELFLLTDKPVLYVANISEGQIGKEEESPHVRAVKEMAQKDGAEVVVLAAAMESEIQQLPEEERPGFLESAGLKEPGLSKVVRAGYQLLGLQTYFTVGEQECRAWTIHKGYKAPQAAGVIHSDFERGFIKAETVAYDALIKCGSVAAAREKGLYRMEGKEYVVKDGDVLLFKFNV